MEFPRDRYLDQLKKLRDVPAVKIITGARRVGKTYLMNTIFRRDLIQNGFPIEKIIAFSFDSDDDLDLLDRYFPNEPTKKRIKGDFMSSIPRNSGHSFKKKPSAMATSSSCSMKSNCSKISSTP